MQYKNAETSHKTRQVLLFGLFYVTWLVAVSIWGTPLDPVSEAINLVSKYGTFGAKLPYLAAYLGLFLFSVTALFFLAFSSSRKTFILFCLLLFFYGVDYAYTTIVGHAFNLSDYIVARQELGNAAMALREFAPSIFVAIVQIVGIIVIIAICRRFFTIKTSPVLPVLAYIASVAGGVAVLYVSDSKRDNFASPIRVPAVYAYASVFSDKAGLNLPYTERILPNDVIPATPPLATSIILIIDESITGQYLSINAYPLKTTPFLESIPDLFINYGNVISTGNLSMNSNYLLRTGLLPSELPDITRKSLSMPSFFTYAKRAGMHTVLIDAQIQVDTMQNYLSPYDLKDIDRYVHYKTDKDRYHNDYMALETIREVLSERDNAFIVVVKYGAHFPYQDRYPPDSRLFADDLSQADSWSNDPRASEDGRRRSVNSYLNAISWNIDLFFKEFLSFVNLETTAIIYTSDHGQSLLDPVYVGNHGASVNPPAAQVSVPLLLFGTAFSSLLPEKPAKNEYSQYQIFPTLLQLFGYSHSITQEYGPTLFQYPAEQVTFSGPLFNDGGKITPLSPGNALIALPDGNFAKVFQQAPDKH